MSRTARSLDRMDELPDEPRRNYVLYIVLTSYILAHSGTNHLTYIFKSFDL